MPHDDEVYLGHMLDMAQKALSLSKNKQRVDYDGDETLRFALAHLLQIIGEAASHVSKECCDSQPQIPWKAVIGMRHKVVHDYMNVNEDVVWGTVTKDLPPLIEALKRIVSSGQG